MKDRRPNLRSNRRADTRPTLSVPCGKERITIRLDADLLAWFRAQARAAGGGSYQALINAALRRHVQEVEQPLEEILRRVIREELRELHLGSCRPEGDPPNRT